MRKYRFQTLNVAPFHVRFEIWHVHYRHLFSSKVFVVHMDYR